MEFTQTRVRGISTEWQHNTPDREIVKRKVLLGAAFRWRCLICRTTDVESARSLDNRVDSRELRLLLA